LDVFLPDELLAALLVEVVPELTIEDAITRRRAPWTLYLVPTEMVDAAHHVAGGITRGAMRRAPHELEELVEGEHSPLGLETLTYTIA
jgi:hypothetical protein